VAPGRLREVALIWALWAVSQEAILQQGITSAIEDFPGRLYEAFSGERGMF
jgi:hypothetical protein